MATEEADGRGRRDFPEGHERDLGECIAGKQCRKPAVTDAGIGARDGLRVIAQPCVASSAGTLCRRRPAVRFGLAERESREQTEE